MYVQILFFDGPRRAEFVEASRRAGRERIAPLIDADPELRTRLIGGFRGLGADGAEVILSLARDEAAIDALERLVMTSELLPGEDPALLTTPSRVVRYAVDDVQDVFGALGAMLANTGVQ